MARSDLLEALIKANAASDARGFRAAAEAIIAEEKSKQHTVLASRLERALSMVPPNHRVSTIPAVAATRAVDHLQEVIPRRTLDELVLPDDCIQVVLEIVEEQSRSSLLRSFGMEPRNRLLFAGPPGTGKTTLAEAIAEALGLSMFVVRYESLIGSYLGETAARLRRIFDYARTTPMVLFFDEIDSIAKERGDEHETGEIKRVVSSFLMQVDELPSYTIVIGATNHPELLDRAAWRRFQVRLNLPLPSRQAVGEYVGNFAESNSIKLGVRPSTIARRLGPISFAELEEFCAAVLRRRVLVDEEISTSQIVETQLKHWSKQFRPDSEEGESIKNARQTNLDTSSGPKCAASSEARRRQ